MITLTESAIAEIKRLDAKRGHKDNKITILRVGIKGAGCTGFSHMLEWSDFGSRATDKIFEFDDIRIVCDPKSLIYLDGTTLDFVTGISGHGFKFLNPNVKGSCGCGESVQF